MHDPRSDVSLTIEKDTPGRPRSERAIICGVDVHTLFPGAPRLQFAAIAATFFTSSIVFAIIQERVFTTHNFEYGGFALLLTSAVYALCAALELRLSTADYRRKAHLGQYVQLSALTLVGMYMTNWSLNYLDYTTRIVAKSCKLVPTMLLGTLMQGKRYRITEYMSAAMLAAGVALFAMGDRAATMSSSALGLGLVTLAIFADAAASNYEERAFFRSKDCSHLEVMVWSMTLTSAGSFAVVLVSGELAGALDFAAQDPIILLLIPTFSVFGYASMSSVLAMVRLFGATETEVVKTVRKAVSIVLSFVLFGKRVTTTHAVGGALVGVAISLNLFSRRRQSS